MRFHSKPQEIPGENDGFSPFEDTHEHEPQLYQKDSFVSAFCFFRVERFEVNRGPLTKKCQNVYSRSLGPEDPWLVFPAPSFLSVSSDGRHLF